MKLRNDRGFTFVEVLVASLVTALSLISMVAFVRKGQEMLTVDKHRRMARGIIERTLENGQYQPENYKNLVSIPETDVVIDADMDPELQGSMTVAVGDSVTQVNGINVPYRPVTATVAWTERDGRKDTVRVAKWLTNVQRN
ncbi:MAG: type II secretion system protein [Chitinispirillaceae bacterium]|nr:type II secretion system protein [Chitinispirillaceae bacterium]